MDVSVITSIVLPTIAIVVPIAAILINNYLTREKNKAQTDSMMVEAAHNNVIMMQILIEELKLRLQEENARADRVLHQA